MFGGEEIMSPPPLLRGEGPPVAGYIKCARLMCSQDNYLSQSLTMTQQLLLMLSCSAALVASMATTTTSAPAQPGQDASLQEVWDWMSSVAESQDQGKLNINMWMSGNKMSMQAGAMSNCII